MSTMEAYKEELGRLLDAFGANVRRARMAMDPPCSQERLSEATQLHRTEIGKIEQGDVEPRLSTLMVLADGLGVSVDELTRGLWVPVERRPSPREGPWK
ncbi:MAG TPA: helix-turn-helix transcriptional regulator [Solirubrobacteraceae bacterium]|nr:helix-turn-helix transcriptional regulator [Solirubrobacteraceae bacterium]